MGRPWVVAHRGASAELAEHTAAAYEQAIALGADAVECDVRLTRDGHLICLHDGTLSRTSDGRGRVSETTLEELRGMDFASWRLDLPDTADGLVADRGGEHRVPVLEFDDLLDMVVNAQHELRLFVETKHPTRFGGLVEEQLVASLARHGLHEPADPAMSPITVMSFASSALRRVKTAAPRLPLVQLYRSIPGFRRDGSLPRGVRITGIKIDIVFAHPSYVRRLHEAGNRCYVWTVDTHEQIEAVLAARVDGIITNRPAEVIAAVRREWDG